MSGEMPLECRLVSEDLGHVVCLDRHPCQPIWADEGLLDFIADVRGVTDDETARGADRSSGKHGRLRTHDDIDLRVIVADGLLVAPQARNPSTRRRRGDRIAAFSCATFDGAVMWVSVSLSPQLAHLTGRIPTTGLSTPRCAMSTGVPQPIEGKRASAKRLVCPCHGWVVQNDALSAKLPQRPMTHPRCSLLTRVTQRTG